MEKGGKKKVQRPIVLTRKIHKVGGSSVIAVPKEWLDQHGIKDGEDVTIVANRDMKILSPESVKEYYDAVTRVVNKPITPEDE